MATQESMQIKTSRLIESRILHTRLTAAVLLPLLVFTQSVWADASWMREALEWTGCAAIFVCVLGRVWCTAYIGGRKKHEIVDVGPYSVSRNPLYLFSFIGTAGIGLLTGSIIWLSVLATIFILYYRVVIEREENFLLQKFGDSYGRYYARTPRWIPDIGLWRDVPERTLNPKLLRYAMRDAACFFLAFPLTEALDMLHNSGAIPVLLSLP